MWTNQNVNLGVKPGHNYFAWVALQLKVHLKWFKRVTLRFVMLLVTWIEELFSIFALQRVFMASGRNAMQAKMLWTRVNINTICSAYTYMYTAVYSCILRYCPCQIFNKLHARLYVQAQKFPRQTYVNVLHIHIIYNYVPRDLGVCAICISHCAIRGFPDCSMFCNGCYAICRLCNSGYMCCRCCATCC